MHKMCRGRVTILNDILIKFWESINRACLEWLTRLFNIIFNTNNLPNESSWRTMIFVAPE